MRSRASWSAFTSFQVGSLLSYAIAIVFPALDAVVPLIEAVRRISSGWKAARATRKTPGTRC